MRRVYKADVAGSVRAIQVERVDRSCDEYRDQNRRSLTRHFRLGGESEFVARRVRRRYGAGLRGSHTAFILLNAQTGAGAAFKTNSELLDALERLSDDLESATFDALRWYYVGSTDADPIPPEVDRIHIRTAIERLPPNL